MSSPAGVVAHAGGPLLSRELGSRREREMFHNKGGRSPDSEMRRLPAISLDAMKFVQVFAAGLRAEFADAACAPVPEYLAALMRELDGNQRPPTPSSCDGIAETQGEDL